MIFALRSVTLLFPLSQSCNFTIHDSLFIIHNCACTSLHMHRGHSPLRLAPRFSRQRTLTAEEWTRQSTSLPCCFFSCLFCFDACLRCFRFCYPALLLSSNLRSLRLLAPLAAPQPCKYGCLALGSSSSLALVRSLHCLRSYSEFATLLSTRYFHNSPLTTRFFSTFPLERR